MQPDVGSRTLPGRTLPGRTLPGRTLPGRTLPGRYGVRPSQRAQREGDDGVVSRLTSRIASAKPASYQ